MRAPSPARPRRLAAGDTVAVLSPSWGGPDAFPHVYDHGVAVLRAWGLEVREYPSTRAPADRLRRDPGFRADDLNAAFADPAVRAIFASIGGDDSIRLLPLLDGAAIAADPKILDGLLGHDRAAGRRPAPRRGDVPRPFRHGRPVTAGRVPAGLCRTRPRDALRARSNVPLPDLRHVRRGVPGLAGPGGRSGGSTRSGRIPAGASCRARAWSPGELFGGCLEVLDWLRGTSAWPAGDEWDGRLLFIETSEEKPTPVQVERILRSFGVMGIFDRIAGLLVGRPRDHSAEEAAALDSAIAGVVAVEFSRPALPIVTDLPFGHTDPQWVLPLGVMAELDLRRPNASTGRALAALMRASAL